MRCTALAMMMLVLLPAAPLRADDARPINFNRDIRPILSRNCFLCHGPDEQARQAELRLDSGENAFRDLGGYAAVVPGSSADSELYRRIASPDEADRMPPAESGKTLSPQEIELIRRWIDAGADWRPHWSYVKPVRPIPPLVEHPQFVRNTLDRFILKRLEEHELVASSEADRHTLIRRLSVDLTGLPPTPEEVVAFVNDSRPDAYERLVDRLLASPHYGERMALFWLDLVRYADTNGYHFDNHRSVHPFRDYVIRSFNGNTPFDQFTIEQVAGDLLPNATLDDRVASGYNRMNMVATEGGVQPKEYLAKYATDRVSTTATVWLGATMGCAECHDHKYDPYTSLDFYSFAALFADLQEVGKYPFTGPLPPEIEVPNERQAAALERLQRDIAAPQQTLRTQTPELDRAQASWEQETRAALLDGRFAWVPLRPETVSAQNGTTLTVQDDLSVLSSGLNPANEVYAVTLRTDAGPMTGLRLEALRHPSFERGSLSRGNGNFVLTGFEVQYTPDGSAEPQPVKISRATADFSQFLNPIKNAIDGNPKTGWSVNGQLKVEDRTAVFMFDPPLTGEAGTLLTVRLKHESDFERNVVGRFRLSVSTAATPALDDYGGIPQEVARALEAEPDQRTDEQRTVVRNYHHRIAPELASVREEIARIEQKIKQLKQEIPTTMVSQHVDPRPMRILPRGNWMDESGPEVEPAVPHFLPQLSVQGRATRIDLATWLVSRDNPLTARVFVNRIWKQLFGRGLVVTLDDLGSQGDLPSHPQLLDYLAVEFMDNGWDVKGLVKTVVMSGTYRQASAASPELRRRDPYNRWLARQSSFRLGAEQIRDNALAVSGLLNSKIGGRSVFPYQPAGYWASTNTSAGEHKYVQDHEGDLYRRGLYTYWKRTFPPPAMLAFDAPSRETCCVERPHSNTPLQALVLLNDVEFVEAARAFAERIVLSGEATTAGRLRFAFHRALSREPLAIEAKVLEDLYQRHHADYTGDPAAARALLQTGEHPAPADMNCAELAAWTSVARTILNLHETITRR